MLPICKVVLFKHGVGYFERQGQVTGDASLDLQFKASEMNDVLKSLTVLDLGGGHIASMSYESTLPIERQLRDLGIRLPEEQGLTGLLAQLKGARVQVEAGKDVVEGVMTGIESTRRQQEQETVWTHSLSLLVDGEALQSFELLEIRRLTFLDPTLKRDLQHLLDAFIATKRKDLKRLTIFARGAGERQAIVSYTVEAPVWKTSYRLLLSEDKPLLQGWALVDNTQDEDWQDVALTLVSGLPVSFVHDLYSPRYKRRPVVQVQEEEAYAPPELEDAVYAAEPDLDEWGEDEGPPQAEVSSIASKKEQVRRGRSALASPARPMQTGLQRTAASRREALERSVAVQSRTQAIGDQFHYQIPHRVTVRRNQSALVPILQAPIGAERVAVYNPGVREKNPLSAVLLTNSSELTLEGGPVTVFDEETYVGESMLETLKPQEKRLVPYSVELGCLISSENQQLSQAVHYVKVQGGSLILEHFTLAVASYSLRNKLTKPLELILEHRRNPGYQLEKPAKAYETTESFYRFRLTLAPQQTTSFEVAEKHQVQKVIRLESLDRKQLGIWVAQRFFSDEVKDQLETLLDLFEKNNTRGQWIHAREREIAEIFENQKRLRENLQSLGNNRDERGLRERYIEALASEEDKLQGLRSQIHKWRQEREELEAQIAEQLKGIQFERKL